MLIILSILFTMTFIAIGALNTDDNEQGGYTWGGETSGSEQKGVMQWTGFDFGLTTEETEEFNSSRADG